MKITSVVVTYNRLDLLKKCIIALNEQLIKPDEIIVINNGSTDYTEQWLKTQSIVAITQPNNGGAAGFSYGINLAYQRGADWIWLMDDDTIPKKDALQKLLEGLNSTNPYENSVGFLSSTVLWTDGNIHEINRTYELKDKFILSKIFLSDKASLPLIQFGTFVSMLLSAKAVKKVGLPIKEFFIWCDDVEYSKRIIASGLAGLSVNDSIVVHETPLNHLSSVFKDTHANLWKYNYGMRNELFTKRMHAGEAQFWITWMHRMFIMPFRIALNRKNHRWAFIKLIWRTSLEAVFFLPKIENV